MYIQFHRKLHLIYPDFPENKLTFCKLVPNFPGYKVWHFDANYLPQLDLIIIFSMLPILYSYLPIFICRQWMPAYSMVGQA